MTSELQSVSFVVPCYRNLRTIGFTLRSIFSQDGASDREVVIVDSSEESVADWLKVHFPKVRLLRPERRLWAGAARNLGAASVRGDLLAFVDADAMLQPNWLTTLRLRLSERPDTVATGGFVENANPRAPASRVLHWTEFSEFLPGRPSGPRRFLSSSNLLVRREEFLRVGGFPEHLPASEDRVLFQRYVSDGVGRPFWDGSTGILHYHRARWFEARAHLFGLGYWGGRVRREHAGLEGGWLARNPAAALLLPLYRTPLILLRVCRAQPRRIASAVALAPLLGLATISWARGFRAGLMEKGAPAWVSGE